MPPVLVCASIDRDSGANGGGCGADAGAGGHRKADDGDVGAEMVVLNVRPGRELQLGSFRPSVIAR